MEEIKKIESVHNSKKVIFVLMIIFLGITVFWVGFWKYCDWYTGWCIEQEKEIDLDYYFRMTGGVRSIWEYGDALFYAMISAIPTVLLIIFYFYISKMKLIVTDKRVYGKAAFGKQVDLPLDSISAVGTSLFGGIAVATSSGTIKFLGISNRDKIHKVIRKLLIERQSENKKEKTSVTHITQEAQSSADELRKYKELLDCGVITQEEFDAKKKQLLGI